MLDDTVVALRQAGNVEDPLTDLLRAGALVSFWPRRLRRKSQTC